MSDYMEFCRHYGLDPEDQDSREQYDEAQRQCARLHAAAATGVLCREDEGESKDASARQEGGRRGE